MSANVETHAYGQAEEPTHVLIALAFTEAGILMKKDQMYSQAKGDLHRKSIKVYPHALEILVLGVHELVHLSNLLSAFNISLCHRLIQSA